MEVKMKRTNYTEEQLKELDKRLENPAFKGMLFNNAMTLMAANDLTMEQALTSVSIKWLESERVIKEFLNTNKERTIIKG